MSVLYTIFILPFELLVGFVYELGFGLTGDPGLTIILLSVFINLITLPLYQKADRIAREAKEQKEKLSFWEEHIKKHFSGDERFMMLQTYYRQNGYKPYYSLKTAFPLLLQVPFFIAAYVYLSGLTSLEGVTFCAIADLSKPDALITIGAVPVNLLPLIMTVLNILAVRFYSDRFRDSWQMYLMAVFFLVLLYQSPSALVLYWTFNQLFSLIKNIAAGRLSLPKAATGMYERSLPEIKTVMSDSFPILFFSFSVFIFSTAEIYLVNSKEFWFTYMDMWSVFAELFFMTLLLGTLLFYRFKRCILPVSLLLYGFSAVFLIQGKVLPYDYGQLNGETIDWGSFGYRPLTNTLLWIIVPALTFFLGIKYKDKALALMKLLARVILIAEILVLLFAVQKEKNTEKDSVNGYLSTQNEFELSSNKNTIILLLDAFDSDLMQQLLREYPDEVNETFEDFTYYHNALGASGNTSNSVPIYLTGFVNEKSLDYDSYMDEAFAQSPLIKELSDPVYDSGFYVSTYLISPAIRPAARNYKIERIKVDNQLRIGLKFLQLTAFKYAPHVLKHYFWLYTEEFNDLKIVEENDIYDTSNFIFYEELCQKGFKADLGKDCFRYYHVNGVHVPYNMNENCERFFEEGQVSEVDQARGCMRIVREFKDRLKESGAYDDSAIMIMADHGWNRLRHQNPLFMMKQRKEEKPLSVSEEPLSYLDLPDMLCDLLHNDQVDMSAYERDIRYYYDAQELKGVTSQTEYEVTGPAYIDDMKPTGRVFSWRYR